MVGGLFGLALGWTGALVYLVPLVPIGVVLLVIDWRTTCCPRGSSHPTYALLAVLAPAGRAARPGPRRPLPGGLRLAGDRGWFWIFWFVCSALGVRRRAALRVLGPALGYLGWAQMLMGGVY